MVYDPVDLHAPTIIAEQLQSGRRPKVTNLSDRIVDMTIESSVQGASILVLSILDPEWKLITSGFISIYDDGFLEPIDINYPVKTAHSDGCWWRLAACAPTTDTSQANLTLTFEDRLVSRLRDLSGPKAAKSGQTREAFIGSLVRELSGAVFVSPTYQQLIKAGKSVGVGSAIATGAEPLAAPASPTAPVAPSSPARRNPSKLPGIDPASRKQVNRHLKKTAPGGLLGAIIGAAKGDQKTTGSAVSSAAGSTSISL